MSDNGAQQEASSMAYPCSSKMWVRLNIESQYRLRDLEYGDERQDADNGRLVGFVG
jgi:hypothetical protein